MSGEKKCECESKVTHTRLKKSTWFREPCHSSRTVGGGSRAEGLVCSSIWGPALPWPQHIPGQGLVSGGWHQPVGLSVGSPVLRISVGSRCFSPHKAVSTGNLCFRLESALLGILVIHIPSFVSALLRISFVSTAAQRSCLRDILLPYRVL